MWLIVVDRLQQYSFAVLQTFSEDKVMASIEYFGNVGKTGQFVVQDLRYLLPDTDERVARVSGISFMAALCLAFWFSILEFAVHEINFTTVDQPLLDATVHVEQKKDVEKKVKQDTPPKSSQKPGGRPKSSGRGNPRALNSRGVLELLATRTANPNQTAYDLMNDQKFANDVDKVLQNVSGLQTTGKTVLGGRRGKATGDFNEASVQGGSGGISGLIDGLIGDGGGAISTTARGNVREPSLREIDMAAGGGSRSAADIMRVVRGRTPGLRHIYTRYLKQKPGFSGKVTLTFTISPGGQIVKINIRSSTTDFSNFDREILTQVKRWTFKKIKSGNTTVTIPFTFSE